MNKEGKEYSRSGGEVLLSLRCLMSDDVGVSVVSHVGGLLGDERRTAGLHLARRRRYLRRGRHRMRVWPVWVRHRRAQVLVLRARMGSAVAHEVAAAAVVVLLSPQALRLHGRDVAHEADDDGDEPQDARCREHPRAHPVAHGPRLPPVAHVAGLHGDADHEHHLGEPEANPARGGHTENTLLRCGEAV